MIYLDAAATTPVRQEVLDVIIPLLTSDYGNPSSVHGMGQTAARALDYARETAADTLGVRTGDVVFTSGGTESNNLAVKGLALANPRGRHLVHSAIEHSSVLESCAYLVKHHGFTLDVAPVDADGILDPDALAALLREDTTLVSVMAVNNEVGTIQPIAEIAAAAHGVGALVHTDAVQAAGWLDVAELARHVDALSLSGHKLGGLKGAGLLMVRGKLALEPLIHGGGQERERRSGTENVAGAVSTATALRLAAEANTGGAANGYGDHIVQTVLKGLNTGGRTRATLTGHATDRVPGIVSFTFPETGGETVLLELERRGVVASSGSACAAGSTEPSHVLLALGRGEQEAHTAVRLSFTRSVKESEIATAARAVVAAVKAIAGP
ncbi:cysteine desulfurase family protein [Paeniglutamicibacter kerguelensis]|uniref:cysteine desulfurase n=1 Tax=Paeniglutamicibacter kerguelensis TaxID=254788 RepID=A0ABS4XAV0_9MICC|nr:cysteine desulfurase family protein [Paeniglutamicibacter kerguelensis]MBP2385501.1 cysteine desulfurase [Paeniglutamicibacter kerguelensis]